MIEYFGKGTIVKGSDCDIKIFLFPCFVDKDTVSGLTCNFYTTSGHSIQKTQEDFTFSGDSGYVHFQYQELDQFEDGVLRYVVSYEYGEGSSITLERASNYFIKTPVIYTPAEFITQENIISAMTENVCTLTMLEQSYSSTTRSDIAKTYDYFERGLASYIETRIATAVSRGTIIYYLHNHNFYTFATYIPIESNTITKWLVTIDKNNDGTYAYTILKKETLYGNVFVFDTELAALEERVARLEQIINQE